MTTAIPKERSKNASATEARKARVAKQRRHAAPVKAKAAPKATRPNKAATARSGSKTAKIIDLLTRPGGVKLKELMKVTGWQPHSVRGFLSGTIAKKRGTPVESFKSPDGERSYRISSK